MFKFVILFAIIAAAAAGLVPAVSTPVLGKLVPQPSVAPASTEHAGYVSGLTPIVSQYVSLPTTYSALAPTVYSAGHVSLPYTGYRVAYAAPLRASYLELPRLY